MATTVIRKKMEIMALHTTPCLRIPLQVPDLSRMKMFKTGILVCAALLMLIFLLESYA
jgi:hypothetical protein